MTFSINLQNNTEMLIVCQDFPSMINCLKKNNSFKMLNLKSPISVERMRSAYSRVTQFYMRWVAKINRNGQRTAHLKN